MNNLMGSAIVHDMLVGPGTRREDSCPRRLLCSHYHCNRWQVLPRYIDQMFSKEALDNS